MDTANLVPRSLWQPTTAERVRYTRLLADICELKSNFSYIDYQFAARVLFNMDDDDAEGIVWSVFTQRWLQRLERDLQLITASA